MIEVPADLIAAFVFFTTLSVGCAALATLPDADRPLFEGEE